MKITLEGFFKPVAKNVAPNPSSFSEASTAGQKRIRTDFNMNDLIVDPGKRKSIEEYDANLRD